jgi:heme/copper-type cytochrome/quinol oxidase subunit 2
MGFQSPATPTMEGIIRFHHDLMGILFFIVVFVGYIIFRLLFIFSEHKHPKAVQVVHGSVIEVVWTLVPAVLLIAIAVPSFALLYSADELIEPAITLKVIGHQW